MNDGVKILLERMQTHPEEFYGNYNRWTGIIERFEKFFDTSERALVNGALTNIRREEFTQIVLNEILQEPVPVEVDPNTYTINTAGRYTGGASVSLAASQKSSLEIFKEEYKKHLDEHEQYLRAVAQQDRFK